MSTVPAFDACAGMARRKGSSTQATVDEIVRAVTPRAYGTFKTHTHTHTLSRCACDRHLRPKRSVRRRDNSHTCGKTATDKHYRATTNSCPSVTQRRCLSRHLSRQYGNFDKRFTPRTIALRTNERFSLSLYIYNVSSLVLYYYYHHS